MNSDEEEDTEGEAVLALSTGAAVTCNLGVPAMFFELTVSPNGAIPKHRFMSRNLSSTNKRTS